jgi:transcriptional regulator with XRE-family HTH domain
MPSLADRLRARCEQLSLHAGQVAELAEVNRSFVYDIMRGRSEHPNLERLDRVAQVLKVERRWLLHGLGEVEGDSPIIEDPDQTFVAIPSVAVERVDGRGSVVDEEQGASPTTSSAPGSATSCAPPADLRIMPCRRRQHAAHLAPRRHRARGSGPTRADAPRHLCAA